MGIEKLVLALSGAAECDIYIRFPHEWIAGGNFHIHVFQYAKLCNSV